MSETPATPGAPVEAPASPPAPAHGWGRWRPVAVIVFVVASLLVLYDQATHYPPTIAGDIWEHWVIAESFDRHGTPELWRGVDDEVVYAQAAQFGYEPPHKREPPDGLRHPYAYEHAPSGRWYAVHFWGYAAGGVPAKAFLRWTGHSELAWPGLSNAMWFLLAIGIALFVSTAPVGERLALVALAAAGPGWQYIGWPGSELFSWAFMLIAVVMYRDRRYGWAGAATGVAALQNSPVILFGGIAFLAAVLERRWRAAAGAAVGSAIGLIPFAFFQYHYGKPSLIARDFARLEYISWSRTWSLLTDLNQGLLPYAPLLVPALVYAMVRVIYLREIRGWLLLAGTAAIAVGTQVSRNWNSGCDGLQRYLVWMLPLAAAVTVWGFGTRRADRTRPEQGSESAPPSGFGHRRALWVLAAAAVVVHSALIAVYKHNAVLAGGYLSHTKVATWVLTHYPKLYWAEPEIFVERTRHDDNWPMTPRPHEWPKDKQPKTNSEYPVVFYRPDGTVSKMLIDADGVEVLATHPRYVADPAYLAELRADAAGRSGSFYAHPPHGAVRVRPGPVSDPVPPPAP